MAMHHQQIKSILLQEHLQNSISRMELYEAFSYCMQILINTYFMACSGHTILSDDGNNEGDIVFVDAHSLLLQNR